MRKLLLACLLLACTATPTNLAEPAYAAQQEGRYIAVLRPGSSVSGTRIASRVLNAFTVPASAVPGLRRNPNVTLLEPIQEVRATGWNLDRVDQRDLPLDGSQFQGTGTGHAYIVDTGLDYDHEEFGGRAVPGFSAFGTDGSDCHGHGTHVAGTVGGATYGAAPAAELVSVQVLDCSGSGTTDQVIAGLDWIAGEARGVVNMSLGGGYSQALNDAVEALALLDEVAVAAGNSAADACNYSPASAPGVLTVAATDSEDRRAWFSNYGSCVDIFSPGEGIVSAKLGGGAVLMDGTSMASPLAAGVALARGVPLDSIVSWSSKNRVLDSRSENAHVVSSIPEYDPDLGDPPPPIALPAPVYSAVADTIERRINFSWGWVSGATAIRVLIDWPDNPVQGWFLVKRKLFPSTSHSQLLEGGTEYTVTVQFEEGNGAPGLEAAPVVLTTCETKGHQTKCHGGGTSSQGKKR